MIDWLQRSIRSLFSEESDPQSALAAHLVDIETPRLRLREFRPDDVDRVYEISKSPGFFYYCFDGTREKAKAFVDRAIDEQKPDLQSGKRHNVLLAILDKSTDYLIGHAAIERVFYEQDRDDYEINFFVDPAYQSKGFGREGIVNLMHYGFDSLGLDRYVVTIHPDNAPSQAVARNEGYARVGETTIDTTRGKEPRTVLELKKETFYKMRQSDTKPMFLVPPVVSGVPERKYG